MTSRLPSFRSLRGVALALLLPVVAWAATVTAAQIIAAVQAAPGATTWLRANAEAVANLAIRVESRGNTEAYNGTCCYGVLQMNRTNIAAYTNLTPEQYRAADLQTQINAWARLTADAMRARAPSALAAMQTFDGRPVDGNLVLACVQLGIGNCQRMINSGSCSGFADRNGTTICSMADRLAGGTPTPGPGTGPGATPTNPGGGAGPDTGVPTPIFTPSCLQDGTGACLPITQALEEGFAQGSGAPMTNLKRLIYAIVAAVVALVLMSTTTTTWKHYSKGRLATANLLVGMKGVALLLTMVLTILTLL
ncbi:MAG TPA: hypothetical protein VMS38_04395 [Pseudorhodoferax sp.]|nr:hypothetical protein [Pseudorhodoferax sp.]